jgi:hypothetical protein
MRSEWSRWLVKILAGKRESSESLFAVRSSLFAGAANAEIRRKQKQVPRLACDDSLWDDR